MGILSRTIMTELDNGVRLCYFHRRGSSVEFQFHILTGSIHEGEYLGCGLSHFLEHMAFQGCAGFPERSVCDIVNQFGGDVNAYTSYDRTCYTMQLPREYWQKGIDMLSAMVRFPECPDARFEAEKQVILRECERGNDDPGQKLFKQFFKTMFISNPMRYPIIGFPEMISQVSREMMMEYHQRRYTPERCVIVVAGELSAAELFEKVDAVLGNWRRTSLAEPVLPDDQVPVSVRKSEVIFQDSAERIFWGVRGPWFGSVETPAVDLLFSVLGTGDNSILNRSFQNLSSI
jgi:zinc protease